MGDTEWNFATFREYFLAMLAEADKRNEQRFAAQEKAVASALQAAKEAVLKAEGAAERRFDAVNEFRAQLADQAATFIPRLEAEQRMSQQAERIVKLESRSDHQAGKAGGVSGLVAVIISGLMVLVAIASVAFAVAQR